MKKILALTLFLAGVYIAPAQTTNYQVHSLFVFNIAKYSTWPSRSGEFHIVVYGKSKIYEELLKNVSGKNINGVIIKVTQADDVATIGDAQIIFLADGRSSNLSELVKATEGKPTMIIAEREGLFKKGAGFSFVLMDNNTLRYDINNVELEKRNIKIAKSLSALANSVI